MRESSEKAMEVNNEAMLNVDEQRDDMTFKLKSDIYDSDEGLRIQKLAVPP